MDTFFQKRNIILLTKQQINYKNNNNNINKYNQFSKSQQ